MSRVFVADEVGVRPEGDQSVGAMTELSFGRRDEALASARRAVELDSVGAMPRAILGVTELAAGDTDAARRHATSAGHTPSTTPWIGWVLAATGDRTGVANLIGEVEAQRGHKRLRRDDRGSCGVRCRRHGQGTRCAEACRPFGADPASFTKQTGARP